jgi:hypothetical protein
MFFKDIKMNYCPYNEQIQEVCISTFKRLIKMYNDPNGSKFIFPHYSDGTIRVSEQEARFTFLNELDWIDDYYFSIETPTKHKYSDFTTISPMIHQRSDNKGRSGEVDMTVYKKGDLQSSIEDLKIFNIEFKKGQPEQSSINKDMLKLYFEEPCGLWFHIIQHTDSGTIQALSNKLNDGLQYVRNHNNPNSILVKNGLIIFFIAILEKNPKPSRYLTCLVDVTHEQIKIVGNHFSENIIATTI